MSRIYAYNGDNQGIALAGGKWEGNVIAVPKGYKLGEFYDITYSENGVTKTVKALAVDRSRDSFSVPKNSELAQLVGSKDVVIKPVADIAHDNKLRAAIKTLKSKTEFKAVGGPYVATGGSAHADLWGQALLRSELSGNVHLNLGATYRPHANESERGIGKSRFHLLQANTELSAGDRSLKLGINTIVDNSIYQAESLKSGGTAMSCGCSGTKSDISEIDKLTLSDGFLDPHINETTFAGITYRYSTANQSLTAAAGIVTDSGLFKNGAAVGHVGYKKKVSEKFSATASLTASPHQVSANSGLNAAVNGKTRFQANVTVNNGEREKSLTAEARLERAMGKNFKAAITTAFRHDFGSNENEFYVRPAAEVKVNERLSVGVAVPMGKRGGKTDVSGVVFGRLEF